MKKLLLSAFVVLFAIFANKTQAQNLIIASNPIAFTLSGGGTYCAGGEPPVVTLSGSSVGVAYQLMSNDSVAASAIVQGTGALINFTPSKDGTLKCRATCVSNGCSLIMNGVVTITKISLSNQMPLIIGQSSVYPGATCTYITSIVPNTTFYTWSVPVGATITSGQGTNKITVKFGTQGGVVNVITVGECGIGSVSALPIVIVNK